MICCVLLWLHVFVFYPFDFCFDLFFDFAGNELVDVGPCDDLECVALDVEVCCVYDCPADRVSC